MNILGIESSCDECAAAVVRDGTEILSNVVATQIPFHRIYNGVVPEIASRMHTEWISGVVDQSLKQAGLGVEQIDAVAATSHPGLLGALLVGLNFAKAFAWARDLPFIGVNHMLAHLYASRLRYPPGTNSAAASDSNTVPPEYPFLGLLVSGGHSIIARVDDFDTITVLGTTIDDAVGEAFDKVSKYYGFGYPGGVYIDRMAQRGDSAAYHFPLPNLYKASRNSTPLRNAPPEEGVSVLASRDHRYDMSYSGLKTAVINQREQFRVKENPSMDDLAASFQKTAVDILLRSLFRALDDTGLGTVVAGGGVAANSYLRGELSKRGDKRAVFPPLELCGDNGAMVAGIGYQYLKGGQVSSLRETASARVGGFKRRYP